MQKYFLLFVGDQVVQDLSGCKELVAVFFLAKIGDLEIYDFVYFSDVTVPLVDLMGLDASLEMVV